MIISTIKSYQIHLVDTPLHMKYTNRLNSRNNRGIRNVPYEHMTDNIFFW